MNTKNMRNVDQSLFPSSFVWGAASSAFQIEGFSTADGGGASVWDTFCHTPDKVANNDTGDIACDAYHRYGEDIALASKIGLTAYRFSISWSRIDPLGDGNWNMSGLAYYQALVDCCISYNIEPYITLHHWELPQALEDQGGWLNLNTAKAFERYAAFIAEHFKGKVTHMITINEPQCIIKLGYGDGVHAPGKQLNQQDLFTCWKHLCLAHGFALRAIKICDPSIQVGIASTGRLCYPETPSSEDYEASREACFQLFDEDWVFTHSLLFDPVCLGHFPPCPHTRLEQLASDITPAEWQIIHAIPDFIAVNIYNGWSVRQGNDKTPEYVNRYTGYPSTALKWPVTERVMNEGIVHIYERYHLPIYISENGLSCNDKIYLDGQVHDMDRIDFLDRYISQLQLATNKADIRGYFHWSLTDNFEWHSGYSERFGLIYVDYPSQQRIPKDSAYWYQQVIASNGGTLHINQ